MTNKEATMILESIQPSCGEKYSFSESEIYEAIDMAISALKKCEPQKPEVLIDTYICPNCKMPIEHQHMNGEILIHDFDNWCQVCGTPIDWEGAEL